MELKFSAPSKTVIARRPRARTVIARQRAGHGRSNLKAGLLRLHLERRLAMTAGLLRLHLEPRLAMTYPKEFCQVRLALSVKRSSVKETPFRLFFGFGIVTVAGAFGAGFYVLATRQGGLSSAFSYLLMFLGASLAAMLASLLFIRSKEVRKP